MQDEPAERKVVSVLFLSLGTAARKNLIDRFPELTVATVQLPNLTNHCRESFVKQRNRTLDRFNFLSRKQRSDESLKQFWNVLTGLAAKCELGEQTEQLVLDMFILNMNNATVQERLCTEPKDNPEEALRFAVAFEEGIKRQQSYGHKQEKLQVKVEPVCSVESKDTCFRCGKSTIKTHEDVQGSRRSM